ncbi:uncharacterized protein N7487_010106 [Penicillium crustosum]|uniref:uncharacterized protein n=1 Tax=Penicillium crustosum TaxID=36656 RepID=UPI002396CD47|nr:uncharacterized protein N7487_010106 [Penicillium crustosum]KAJ5395803.1 hypothetical protein N7487_010106 [Penicillium crustosum]
MGPGCLAVNTVAPSCRHFWSLWFLFTQSMTIRKHNPVIWANSENAAHSLGLDQCFISWSTRDCECETMSLSTP